MARPDTTPSKMEILALSSLARQPMHGYEIKMELRYKHVRWWAKCDHGHLYGTLSRLEKRGFVRALPPDPEAESGRPRKVLEITESGRGRLLQGVERIGEAEDSTYFDVDVFLSCSFLLEQDRVLEILRIRRARIEQQHEEASELGRTMSNYVPAVAHLIIEHRQEHLARELAFLDKVVGVLAAQSTWGSFLGGRRIQEHVDATGVALEP